jgi:glycosyltransferase involved in cell wall biosynthesis
LAVKPTRRRVLICSNAYPPNFIGGAELVAHYQARALQDQGWNVAVLAGDPHSRADRYSVRRDSHEGVTVHRIALHPIDYDPNMINFSHRPVERYFEDVLRDFQPHVVHCHNLVGLSVKLLCMARLHGCRTVLTLHDHWGFCYRNTLLRNDVSVCNEFSACAGCMPFIHDGNARHLPIRLRNDFLALQIASADALVFPSRYLRDAYRQAGLAAERAHVIPYGIDVDRFRRVRRTSARGMVRFSFIGYLGRHKGIHVLLEASAKLARTAEFALNIVGDGDARPSCDEQVKALALEGKVRFWGKLDNARVEEVYRQTDVLILPSIWPENHPVSITEAMAAGIPVIASRIGGIPEQIEDGVTGHLFIPGDSADLARCMLEFIGRPGKVEELGATAQRSIAHNSFAHQVEKIARLYEKAVAAPPPPPTPVIACAGTRFDPEVAGIPDSAIAHARVVMADWLEPDELQRATLLWVVDADAELNAAVVGLEHGLPLLVPEENAVLRTLCVQGKCGLYYRDAAEAIACLEYLHEQESTKRAMGENGARLAREIAEAAIDEPRGRKK